MATVSVGDSVGMDEGLIKLIKKACSVSTKANQKSSEKLYHSEKITEWIIFSFPGSWSVKEWISKYPFGELKLDPRRNEPFHGLRYIGLDHRAVVNEAFYKRFQALLADGQFENEVKIAVAGGKRVLFTGHSSGGAIAMLATIWFLEQYGRSAGKPTAPRCVTFGSPLVGDDTVNHAVRREKWSDCFINFVMRYDIVPRVLLSPVSSAEQEEQLQLVLKFFETRLQRSVQMSEEAAKSFYETVIRNASSVASRAACKIMGSTSLLLETVASFIELSPYRPFGTYVFCTNNGKFIIVENPDAILQLLFYSSRLSSPQELVPVAQSSLNDHLSYKDHLERSLDMRAVLCLNTADPEYLPLSPSGPVSDFLNDLGLGERGILCLRAAAVFEQQKVTNQKEIDKKKTEIGEVLKKLEDYKNKCATQGVCYYDAFKKSKYDDDFKANVARLELAGLWDEIVEMLKRFELPDGFEVDPTWVELGTRFRRMVEPLDIANYYRHLKNEDTGPYIIKGRPKRYKCNQRWREHAEKMTEESLESVFWAHVEELRNKRSEPGKMGEVTKLRDDVKSWILQNDLTKDVLLTDSTYRKLLEEYGLPAQV